MGHTADRPLSEQTPLPRALPAAGSVISQFRARGIFWGSLNPAEAELVTQPRRRRSNQPRAPSTHLHVPIPSAKEPSTTSTRDSSPALALRGLCQLKPHWLLPAPQHLFENQGYFFPHLLFLQPAGSTISQLVYTHFPLASSYRELRLAPGLFNHKSSTKWSRIEMWTEGGDARLSSLPTGKTLSIQVQYPGVRSGEARPRLSRQQRAETPDCAIQTPRSAPRRGRCPSNPSIDARTDITMLTQARAHHRGAKSSSLQPGPASTQLRAPWWAKAGYDHPPHCPGASPEGC